MAVRTASDVAYAQAAPEKRLRAVRRISSPVDASMNAR